jgi:HSP20 family molecular chaperone IbpA
MGDKDEKDRIKELEEKLKKLEAKEEKDSGGVAAGVLRGLGKAIPGLGDMVKGLEGSKVFQERLKEIDKRVDTKLKEAPLKQTGRTIIPPRTTLSRETLAGKPFIEEEAKKPVERDIMVDIFDEADHLEVIAELPGVKKGDVKIDVTGRELVISANTLNHKYHKKVTLPCDMKNDITSTLKNGVLEIKLDKE